MATQTVIGFFDDHAHAQRAIEQLKNNGISRDRIDLSSRKADAYVGGSSTAGAAGVNPVSGSTRDENSVSRTADGHTVDPEGRNTNKFTDFFNNLFGGKDNDDADRYSRVAQGSNSIVTVHAKSDEEAHMAAQVLDDAGAIDVDEKATKLGFGHSRSQGMGHSENYSGSSNTSSSSLQQHMGATNREADLGGAGMRSRIVPRSVDDHNRLRDDHGNIDR